MSTTDNACPECGQIGTHVCSLAGSASIAPMPPGFCRDCDASTGRCPAHSTQTFTVGVVAPATGSHNPAPVLSPTVTTLRVCDTHPGEIQLRGCLSCMNDLRAEAERLTQERDEWRDSAHLDRARLESALIEAHDANDALRARLDRLTCERDEAQEDLEILEGLRVKLRAAQGTAERAEKDRDAARAQAAAEAARAERLREALAVYGCFNVHQRGAADPCPKLYVSRESWCSQCLALALSATDALAQHDAALLARARPVVEALRDLMEWGVELDDDRLRYVVVQVDRDNVDAARAALAAWDAGEKGPPK